MSLVFELKRGKWNYFLREVVIPVITGFANLLADEELTTEQKEYTVLITKAGKSLLGIIDDILDYSRIEAGKLEIKLENCSLKKLLEDIDSIMRLGALIFSQT